MHRLVGVSIPEMQLSLLREASTIYNETDLCALSWPDPILFLAGFCVSPAH